MIEWITARPITTGLLCWLALLAFFYGGVFYLCWRMDRAERRDAALEHVSTSTATERILSAKR